MLEDPQTGPMIDTEAKVLQRIKRGTIRLLPGQGMKCTRALQAMSEMIHQTGKTG